MNQNNNNQGSHNSSFFSFDRSLNYHSGEDTENESVNPIYGNILINGEWRRRVRTNIVTRRHRQRIYQRRQRRLQQRRLQQQQENLDLEELMNQLEREGEEREENMRQGQRFARAVEQEIIEREERNTEEIAGEMERNRGVELLERNLQVPFNERRERIPFPEVDPYQRRNIFLGRRRQRVEQDYDRAVYRERNPYDANWSGIFLRHFNRGFAVGIREGERREAARIAELNPGVVLIPAMVDDENLGRNPIPEQQVPGMTMRYYLMRGEYLDDEIRNIRGSHVFNLAALFRHRDMLNRFYIAVLVTFDNQENIMNEIAARFNPDMMFGVTNGRRADLLQNYYWVSPDSYSSY